MVVQIFFLPLRETESALDEILITFNILFFLFDMGSVYWGKVMHDGCRVHGYWVKGVPS